MRKYEVIEDNGGGLTLVVFNNNGIVDYLHSGYEYGTSGRLMDDIQALKMEIIQLRIGMVMKIIHKQYMIT